MTPEVNLEGFREAAVRMRQSMGTDVAFFTKSQGSYPPGTSLDPETGQPFDPTVPETGSGWASASLRVGVYTSLHSTSGPRSREDDVFATPVGWFEEGNAVLDADPDEYAEVESATEVEVSGIRYEIADVDGSAIDDVEHRKLIYIRRT